MTADDSVPVLIQKIEALSDGMDRLEALIRNEIQELKTEQIAELRRANERLADDQRRAWDAIRALENERHQAAGGFRVIHGIIVVGSTIIGAVMAALVAKFTK